MVRMSTDSLMSKSLGSRISTYFLMGNISDIVCARHSLLLIIYQHSSVHFFITHIQQRRGWILLKVDDSSDQSWNTHKCSGTIRYKSMTSANGRTYAGHYPCDGWVDNLEPTISMTIFLIQGHNLKKPLINYQKKSTENRVNCVLS